MDQTVQRPFLTGQRISLRPLAPDDVRGPYQAWVNDYDTTRYLETGRMPVTPEALKRFVDRAAADPNTVLLAIVRRKPEAHIGNLKLGPIDWTHRHAALGILIGDSEARGKGYGTEAVELLVDYAFNRLNLHKVTLGVYADHKASITLFERLGFSVEGRLRQHLFREGRYHDKLLMGLLREEFRCR